jgi:quercetin dioxygenase-like cupin family protein
MSRSMIAIGAIVAAGIIVGAVGVEEAKAAEKKEVYVSPGADRKAVFTGSLHGMDGHEVTIEQFTFLPGWVGGKHYHTGPVFVYILEGAFSVTEQGKKDQTFNAGALYQEPIGTPMQARNLSMSEPLKVLLIQVGRKGEPLMIKAD